MIPEDKVVRRIGARIEVTEGTPNRIGLDVAGHGTDSTAVMKEKLVDLTEDIG